MELSHIQNSKIYLDTNIFIYAIENMKEYQNKIIISINKLKQ